MTNSSKSKLKIKILSLFCVIISCITLSADTDINTADTISREIIQGELVETNGYFERECWEKLNDFLDKNIIVNGAIYDYKIDNIGNKYYCNYKIRNKRTSELEAWLIVLTVDENIVKLVKVYVY